MNEYDPTKPVGQMPGADRVPSVMELTQVENMRIMTAVGQAFVDTASLEASIPPIVVQKIPAITPMVWRLISGNMSPEAQSIAYESARQSAIAAGTDPNAIEYPVGKNALTLDQALDISSRYTIAQLPNDPTGFSGTVLKEIPTRIQQDSGRPLEVVVALRDTEFRPNSLGGNHDQDMTGADLGELMTTGASFGQIAQADALVNNIVRPLLADGETVRFASGSLSGHISQAVQLLNPDIVDTSTPWSNVAFNPTNLPRLFDTSGQLTEGQILRMAVDTYVEVRDNPASVQSWLPQHGVQDESQLLANTRLLDNAIHDERRNALFVRIPALMPLVGRLLDPEGTQYRAGSGTSAAAIPTAANDDLCRVGA